MEPRTTQTSGLRRLFGRRLLGPGLVALALTAVVVAGVSANGGPGGGGGPGGRGGITITAISGSQLSLTTEDGWTRTLDATGAAVVNGTATITLGDLKVGDEIAISEARNFDGSVTVTQIAVVAPDVNGTVTAIDANSLTVKQADGTSRTVTLTATTTYSVNRGTSTKDAITVGSDVDVQGTANADGSFTATSVSSHPASLGGKVTVATADSITVADASGATATIKVTASTTYRNATGTGSLADAVVGAVVRAEGVRNADGSLTATAVAIGSANGDFGGRGRGGHGGHGFGPGGPDGQDGQGGQSGTQPTSPAASPSASPSA